MIQDKATEKIENNYNLQGINLLLITRVTLPENERNILYAVFKEEGVTIYDYTLDEELIEFGSLIWDEFPYVTIKNLKAKSTISFIADGRFRRMTVINDDSEEIERFLKEHTPVEVNTTGMRWYNKIPGFRSETRWKMIMSVIIYLWFLTTVYNSFIG